MSAGPPDRMDPAARGGPAVAVFSLSLFLSALLLFSVQPLFAKMALPMLGGAPAVWNTCAVFFQVVLLLGYGYAHLSTRWLGARRQAAAHLLLLASALAILPIRMPDWTPPAGSGAILWLLGLLTVSVGLPFFVVSASAPLLQRWFAQTGHPSARDPYFLYAASNLGSLLALLSYPFLIEPRLALLAQTRVWAVGYAGFVAAASVCAILLWRAPVRESRGALPAERDADGAAPVTIGRRLRWVILAGVPSSLLLGVTTYLSTDLAPVPLLWVVPLALYLFTFVLVFAKHPPLPRALVIRIVPLLVLPLVMLMASGVFKPLRVLIPLHLLAFFVMAMVCHGELAEDRPDAGHLTGYYLWMSVGGALGGLFNALLAPLIFDTVLEYPLAIVAACLLWPGSAAEQDDTDRPNGLDVVLPLALAGLIAGQTLTLRAGGMETREARMLFAALPAAIACASFRFRPIRFSLGVAALLFVGTFSTSRWARMLHVERSFFGVYQVTEEFGDDVFRAFTHGTTLHGLQSLNPARRREPLTYFSRSGPAGQIFGAFEGPTPRLRNVAVVGLGAGSLSCYATPGQRWTFYEIDPVVERIARDPRLFTYLRDCVERVDVVLGDARLSLRRAPDRGYDLLVLDAFSSDAIPLHLLTREALRLYLAKLAEHGLLALHITNRHLSLEPVLAKLAEAEGLTGMSRRDPVTPSETLAGKAESQWVVIARRPEDLGPLTADARWAALHATPGTPLWTDDFSNLLSVFHGT